MMKQQISARRLRYSKPRSGSRIRYRPTIQALERRDLPSGFGSLVQVSGLSPWQNTSDTNGQPGTYYLNSEVEPSLAVDPTNPEHTVGVWQQDRWSNGGSRGIVAGVSMDGGNTWTSVPLPGVTVNTGGTFLRASDPWVTFAPDGSVYVASLVGPPGFGEGIYVSKSTTGGFSWQNPSVIIDDSHNIDSGGNFEFFDDKESITADPTNANNVYVVWDRLNLETGTSGPAMFSRTTDGGVTWSAPQSILDPSNGQTLGNQIVVLPNGVLVNITTTQDYATNAIELVAMRSTDHGSTWSAPINISTDTAIIATDPNNTSLGIRTGEQLPAVAVDHRSGNIYIAWEDTSFSGGAIDQIAFTTSYDGGLDWTAPAKINQTPTSVPLLDQQAFTPCVAVAASGEVAVSYYDFRNNTGGPGVATDAWIVFANPAQSLTFGNEQRLTPTSFNIELAPYAGWGYFVGDYEGLVAGGLSFNTFGAFFGEGISANNPTNIVFRGVVPPSTYGQPIYLSGLTPWANTSDIPGQTGTNYLNSAVEPSIAADPRNPLHMVAVWQQDRWSDGGSRGIMAAVTTDGGASWTDVAIPGVSASTGGSLPRASDPWVSIARNGDVYVSILSAISASGPDETVYVSKSTDGGYTWGTPTAIISDTDPHFFDDKETVTADPTNSNNVYVTWDRLTADPITNAFINGPAMLSRSTDGGQTWTNSVIFAGGTNTQTLGNQIVVLPDGTLLDLFDYFDFNANTATFEVARSTDHGASWSAPIVVAADDSIGVSDPNNSNNGVRAGGSIPGIAVNRTTGAVYIVWEDARFSGFAHEAIAISQSTNGGTTWSTPTQVNQTPTSVPSGDQQAFTPQVAVAANGMIAVTYYDFRNNTSGPALATDYWVAFANPGTSLTFGNEQRLTPSSFDGELAPNAFGLMIGDYMGLTAGGVSFNTFASAFEETISAQNPSRIMFENISAPDTFVVTNTSDNTTNPAIGSLRWAINQANNHPGQDYIYFDIGPGGPQTITPLGGLPPLTDTVVIDATTQPGYAGKPIIELSGAAAGGATGIFDQASSCIIKGLVVNGFTQGIYIYAGTNNLVFDNYIGTDLTGTMAVPNSTGVFILYGTHNDIVENVISGNTANGVLITGSGAASNIVEGNDIGTNASGSAALGNGGAGVEISGSPNNVIGRIGLGNTIAFNGGAGVVILDSASTGNQIRGNSIYSNGALGIDLGGDGVTANHTGTASGPNNFQNFPVLDVARNGPVTRVLGTLNALPNTTYVLDFFASLSPDPSAFGQGQRYLGSGMVTTDGSGNASFDSSSFTSPLGASLQTEFITATATDPAGNTSEFSEARQANAGPVAVNDAFVVQNNTSNNSLPVLANDFDPAGDSFFLIATGTPGHGSASISGSSVLYTPAAGYFGPDSFTYTISDAFGDTSTATVNITVNAPPIAVNDSATVQENSGNNPLAVLANDSDPDGDSITIIGGTTPTHGMVAFFSNVIQYSPQSGYYGADSFTYTISDGEGGTASATVFITVNAPPVAVNDSFTVQQNSSNNSLSVLANDSDPDGDPVSIASVGTPGHGTASSSGSSILYTPTAGYSGPDSFSYTISDGQGGTSTASVSINVTFRPVTITGTVFGDLNDNHIQDPGETGLSGWTVKLDGGAMSVMTNASGQYTFTGVGPGTHTISEVVQSAYIETSPRGDTFTINTNNGVDVSGKNFSNEIPTNARDNSLNGYSEHGGGWTTINGGWLGNSRAHVADLSGNSFASWQMNIGAPGGVPAGKYEVFVSYVPAAGRATNAPYTIADNKTVLGTLTVNQTLLPNDGLYQGISWRSLGVFTFNSGKPIITLNANANGSVDADGVLLIPASAFAPPMSPQIGAAATLGQISRFPKVQSSLGSSAAVSRDVFFSSARQSPSLEGLWLGAMPPAAGQVDALFADRSQPQTNDLDSALLSLLVDTGNA